MWVSKICGEKKDKNRDLREVPKKPIAGLIGVCFKLNLVKLFSLLLIL
ncbi:MAG: hypothetical protein ACI94L_001062 [Flavobacteriaceae bacterium]|jgi:hypothetical protein